MVKERWVNKNIDLDNFSELIKSFLNSHGVSIEKDEFDENSRCLVVKGEWGSKSDPQKYRFRRSRRVTICIDGHSNDFIIELDANAIEKGFKSSRMIGHLLSLFGGGIILVESIKAQEAYNLWEEQFWKFVRQQIANLTDSNILIQNDEKHEPIKHVNSPK